MPKRTFETKPRINYRKIRTNLLRACLESFLLLLVKPTAQHLKEWLRLEEDYIQLTNSRPLRIWVFSRLREFKKNAKTAGYWFELLESVKEVDDELDSDPGFFFRYLAASPFKGMIVFWTTPHLGPNKREITAQEISLLRIKHGIRHDESPRYSSDNGRFVAFPMTASDMPTA